MCDYMDAFNVPAKCLTIGTSACGMETAIPKLGSSLDASSINRNTYE